MIFAAINFNGIGNLIIWIIVAIIVIIAFFFLTAKRRKRERLSRLESAFGKPPTNEWYDTEPMAVYYDSCSEEGIGANDIDDITWDDLNMDDVFRRINVCASSVGEEYLYKALHELILDDQELKRREDFMEHLSRNPKLRLELQDILAGIGKRKYNRLGYYLFHATDKQIARPWVFITMALIPVLAALSLIFSLQPGMIILVLSALTNILVHQYYHRQLESELGTMNYFSALLAGANKLADRGDILTEAIRTQLNQGLKPFRHLRGWVPVSAKPVVSDLDVIGDYLRALFLFDLIRFNYTLRLMNKHRKALQMLYEGVGKLDTAVCVLSFRKSLPAYCLPEFIEEKKIIFQEMYHPLLSAPVTNSGTIGNDSLITGSNASGKSTFIKALAVNNILAQTIHSCCAGRYALRRAFVATSMALRDDLLSGESYFITEIKSLKRIIDHCRERYCTCFIDEILRGTNTPERIAASSAVMRQLHEYGSLCLVASHDIELTRILAGVFDNYHFRERISEQGITFDYTLQEGPSNTTNAIKLLSFMGFDRKIISEAERMVGQDSGQAE